MKKQLCFTTEISADVHANFAIEMLAPVFAGWKRVNWFIQPYKEDDKTDAPAIITLVVLYESAE